MYKTKMLCSHMIFQCIQKGEKKIDTIQFPSCPQIKLKLETRYKIHQTFVDCNILGIRKQRHDFNPDDKIILHAA